jgi:fumarate reductase flavoprotein subunit
MKNLRKLIVVALLMMLVAATGAFTGCKTAQKTDVIVVGAGGAGLASAVSAAENGAKVLVLEKMPMIGGNTIRAGGAYNAVDPEKQTAQGIKDSLDLHYQQTYDGGDRKGDPALIHVLVNNSLAGLKWLESYGMKFNDKIGSVVGSLWPRSHQATDPAGTGYINTLKGACDKLGVTILTDTKVTDLIQNKDGRIVGVKATDKDGKAVEYLAGKGVVIAAGGFSANVEMRMKYDPRLTADFPTTNQPGATGDGIIMAEKVNADEVGMQYIQLIPIATPKTGSLQGGVTINIESVAFINANGERFIKEDARRDVLSTAVLKQPGASYYMVNDSKIVGEKNEYAENIQDLVKSGSILKADTLAELATKMGVPADKLEKTITEFNGYVKAKKDPLGRAVWAGTIDKGPFYAVKRVPAVHHTMGGLKIDTECHVISKSGTPIAGLYAAGEVTGGIHGTNRLGGNALPDTIVFGRIAGKNVAAETAN